MTRSVLARAKTDFASLIAMTRSDENDGNGVGPTKCHEVRQLLYRIKGNCMLTPRNTWQQQRPLSVRTRVNPWF